MDIEDAFTQEAIAVADTNVVGEDEEYLRQMVARICADNEIPPMEENHASIAMLFFVAGRTYQSDLTQQTLIDIPMTPNEVHEYIAYLAAKGSP